VGRLDSIIERNRNPKWFRGKLSFGLRSLFLLVIIIALLFTDWALAPEDHRDLAPKIVPAGTPRVDGVQLRRAPTPPRSNEPAPTATTP
jgi:hypothetical protein